jgi:asparagine synthase (glutamine-hydrolysing)
MCGLCGIYAGGAMGGAVARDAQMRVRAMTATLAPRGPDGVGLVATDSIVLGHRRLSILELSDAGAQPMQAGETGAVIAYNGEIYNHRELRGRLDRDATIEWRGHSDTEVALQVYAAWGLHGLKQLEGIFALALWDPAAKRLILMRDRLGVKPLYWGHCTFGLAFGSEIKAVLAAGSVDTGMDDQAFREYLWFGNTHEDRTFYRGVRQLPPGHWLIAEGGKTRIEPWFRIEEWLEQPPAVRRFEDAVPVVRDAIDAAVKRQLMADVPIGLFLSGGLDSSAIAAAARAADATPLAFTATFDFEAGINELAGARQVAEWLHLEHKTLEIGGAGLWDTIERLAAAHDEPFADAANIPLYLMAKALNGSVKVVLQGDGGDELFAGYRRYAILRNARWWRLWPAALTPIARQSGNLGRRFARMASSVGAADPALRMARLLTVNTPEQPPESLFTDDRRRALEQNTDPFRAHRHAASRFAHHDPVQQMLLTDLTVQLPSQFLPKVDRATMAAGVEARVPLLDEQVARLVVGMPSNWKARGLERKALLRAALRDRVPDQIIDGPKTGFGVPYEQWLRTSLFDGARERLLDASFVSRFGLCARSIESELQTHRSRPSGRGFLLWSLLQASVWSRHQRTVVA